MGSVHQALKEKTELQAQLASVNAQLQAQKAEAHISQETQSTLTTEVDTLRQSCGQLEKAMVELQGNLENKNASLASLNNDLKVAEDQYNRLMGKVEELQNAVTLKDGTGETRLGFAQRPLDQCSQPEVFSALRGPHMCQRQIQLQMLSSVLV